ncbi:FUSC family protein [Mycolicibacterium neoaurum]|uniref:FUSC family protein n=1 Tax=Mycolicibacterium neoaurum TaxID=1795 RepID=UPI0026711BDA|nr:FUSC family protein [Mycolicibacterium neoaurum]MDO3400900.1 FUSC family protein [Mycolicibacterium neoaurum]
MGPVCRTGTDIVSDVLAAVRRFLVINPAPGRWQFAARAGICMAIPVLVGWLLGDTGAGLIAVIGGFTSLYGSGRPYRNRAGYLATIAACFAAAVALGDWAAAIPVLGLVTITVIAMVAVLVCHALSVGPPGAFMFVLGCAAGTATASTHLPPWHIGLLVLAGGAFSWVVHMLGALWEPLVGDGGRHGPEARAVAAARTAVERYRGSGDNTDRHLAAKALHQAWTTLVNYQPTHSEPDAVVDRLRAENLYLHRVFGAIVDGARATDPAPAESTARVRLPMGRPGNAALLRRALSPGSESMRVSLRVGVAVALSGAAALLFTADHSYWAMATAVLVLYQGFDWSRTVQRGAERMVGTLLGLGLAAAILAWQPQGWWLVAVVAVLQFSIEMFVVRNYTIAVIFITPLALTIATGGRPVADLGHFLVTRGLDTVIGCVIALLVYRVALRRHGPAPLKAALARTVAATHRTDVHLRAGAVSSTPARAARRDLQLSALALLETYQAAIGGSAAQRADAERLWPTVAAAEQAAYQTLAACWVHEHPENG